MAQNCDQIKELIIRASYLESNKEELQAIREHTTDCQNCNDLAGTLEILTEQLQNPTGLKPPASLQENIRRRFLQRYPNRHPDLVARFISIWTYKVPVYKITLAAVVILFIASSPLLLSLPERDAGVHPVRTDDTFYFDHPTSQETIHLLEGQKVGRSVKDDSLLSQYSFTL